MPTTILTEPFSKILVIGSLHQTLPDLKAIEQDYDRIVFNGGLFHCPDNYSQMLKLLENDKITYVAGKSDYLYLLNCQDEKTCQWINARPNIVIANFPSRKVLIMDGGLPINTTHQDIINGVLEASFVSLLHQKSWHQFYNGGFGYVVSNNPITNQFPKHYNYSMQLGHQDKLYAQEIDDVGLKRLIELPINKTE